MTVKYPANYVKSINGQDFNKQPMPQVLKVSKLLILDPQDNRLLLYRNGHPAFGNDPDLPGGTAEPGEEPLHALIREVYEEIGLTITESQATLLCQGTDQSSPKTTFLYYLYIAKLPTRPTINLSHEHSTYQWLEAEAVLYTIKTAKDTYMHMVYDQLK